MEVRILSLQGTVNPCGNRHFLLRRTDSQHIDPFEINFPPIKKPHSLDFVGRAETRILRQHHTMAETQKASSDGF
jgi:hypothetical protein